MSFKWKANFSRTEYRIFRGKVIAGILKQNLWKSEGRGELDGHMMQFKTKGLFQRKTDILDIEGKQIIGEIEYRLLKGQAIIKYNSGEYHWAYESWTRRKWTVKSETDTASFKINSFWRDQGEVENDGIPASIILASLYIEGHFRKMTAGAE